MSPNCGFFVCFLRAGVQNKDAEGLPSLAKITSTNRQLMNLVSPISLIAISHSLWDPLSPFLGY